MRQKAARRAAYESNPWLRWWFRRHCAAPSGRNRGQDWRLPRLSRFW